MLCAICLVILLVAAFVISKPSPPSDPGRPGTKPSKVPPGRTTTTTDNFGTTNYGLDDNFNYCTINYDANDNRVNDDTDHYRHDDNFYCYGIYDDINDRNDYRGNDDIDKYGVNHNSIDDYVLCRNRPISFDTGLADCEGRGGHPVSITDAGENAFVNQLYLSNRPPSIDCSIYGRDPCQVMYIGLRRNSLDQFKMVDGTEWGNCCGFYTNWAPGEDNRNYEKCAEARADGKWADILCDFGDHDHHFLIVDDDVVNYGVNDNSVDYRVLDHANNY
ncbi:hypothetical protein AAVH_22790 [Aphelenchoides avenae]|nr:hypothetical protein AAVH_22790 [Aphelenchus avenae]